MIFTPDEASKYLQAIVIHERINSGTNIQDFAMACYRLKSRAETAERELAELRKTVSDMLEIAQVSLYWRDKLQALLPTPPQEAE